MRLFSPNKNVSFALALTSALVMEIQLNGSQITSSHVLEVDILHLYMNICVNNKRTTNNAMRNAKPIGIDAQSARRKAHFLRLHCRLPFRIVYTHIQGVICVMHKQYASRLFIAIPFDSFVFSRPRAYALLEYIVRMSRSAKNRKQRV